MGQDLDTLLGVLNSDESRFIFMMGIYVPGNTDVADRILSMADNTSIIKKEIAYAKETDDTPRFRELAKKQIDNYVKNDLEVVLREEVIDWQDSQIADYAIEQLTSSGQKDRDPADYFEGAIHIAETYGKLDVATELLERLLSIMEKYTDNKIPIAKTLEKLGRFDEAIDNYVESGNYNFLNSAMRIAKKHSPGRVEELARKGFDSFGETTGDWEFYIQCAEKLGKSKKAEKSAVRSARRTADSFPMLYISPSRYESLVKSLVKFGRLEEAGRLVARIVEQEEELNNGLNYCYDSSIAKEIARLYHAIGQTDAVRDIYTEIIDDGIRRRNHSSNVLKDIQAAVEVTGDLIFKEKKLMLYEREGEFQKASDLALELGKSQLAENYAAMQQMIDAAQSGGSK